MAEESKITWTRSTFNPWIGCTKVSPGCDHCYASVSTPTRTMGVKWGAGETRIMTSLANWRKPLVWNKRAQASGEFWPVFCASLADVFDNEVPAAWRAALFELIVATPYLTWLLLTKRIGNAYTMMEEATAPIRARDPGYAVTHNIWLGATVVNQEEADRDIPKLLDVPAAKRFVSYEPALDGVDWAPFFRRPACAICGGRPSACQALGHRLDADRLINWNPGLDWIIIGGESDQPGMKARPFAIEWARSTVRQCKTAGVPVFVKQIGSAPKNWCAALLAANTDYRQDCDADHCDNYEAGEQGVICFLAGARCVYLEDRAGADPAEWPEDLRVQDMPSLLPPGLNTQRAAA